jgi:hypothetical protein
MSRFTEEDFVSAGSFEYKAPEEVGCCIFDFMPAEMCQKNRFLPELPLFFNCFGEMNECHTRTCISYHRYVFSAKFQRNFAVL